MSANGIIINEIGKLIIDDGDFYIELKEEYKAGIKGLQGFSHIQVLWWCHHNDTEIYRNNVECHSAYKTSPEILGTFATRSPFRPNPVGLTATKVKSIDEEKGIIHLFYLDADHESPIIDIKPYHPSVDRVKKVTVPKWCEHWPKWQENSMVFDWENEFNF